MGWPLRLLCLALCSNIGLWLGIACNNRILCILLNRLCRLSSIALFSAASAPFVLFHHYWHYPVPAGLQAALYLLSRPFVRFGHHGSSPRMALPLRLILRLVPACLPPRHWKEIKGVQPFFQAQDTKFDIGIKIKCIIDALADNCDIIGQLGQFALYGFYIA